MANQPLVASVNEKSGSGRYQRMSSTTHQPAKRMRSVEASQAVWQTSAQLSRSELLVLQALASHADTEFRCYPSLDRLAKMVRLSKRQVIRVLHGLREKRLIAFDENPGGRSRCNEYHLLVAVNSDINSDVKSDTTKKKGDIMNGVSATFSSQRVTFPTPNSDIAVSPEWFEGLGIEKPESIKAALVFCNEDTAIADLENSERLEKLIENILAEGVPVTRRETCGRHGHGPFVRSGQLWKGWVLWNGKSECFGNGFSLDAGCYGCQKEREAAHANLLKRTGSPWNIKREFDLRAPVICPTHGPYILKWLVTEHSQEHAQMYGVPAFSSSEDDMCPECLDESLIAGEVSDLLGWSNEQWERSRELILQGIALGDGVARKDRSPMLAKQSGAQINDLRLANGGKNNASDREGTTTTSRELSTV